MIREGRVGQPRRDPTTGFLTNHHLGTTDVTRQVSHIYIPLKKTRKFKIGFKREAINQEVSLRLLH